MVTLMFGKELKGLCEKAGIGVRGLATLAQAAFGEGRAGISSSALHRLVQENKGVPNDVARWALATLKPKPNHEEDYAEYRAQLEARVEKRSQRMRRARAGSAHPETVPPQVEPVVGAPLPEAAEPAASQVIPGLEPAATDIAAQVPEPAPFEPTPLQVTSEAEPALSAVLAQVPEHVPSEAVPSQSVPTTDEAQGAEECFKREELTWRAEEAAHRVEQLCLEQEARRAVEAQRQEELARRAEEAVQRIEHLHREEAARRLEEEARRAAEARKLEEAAKLRVSERRQERRLAFATLAASAVLSVLGGGAVQVIGTALPRAGSGEMAQAGKQGTGWHETPLVCRDVIADDPPKSEEELLSSSSAVDAGTELASLLTQVLPMPQGALPGQLAGPCPEGIEEINGYCWLKTAFTAASVRSGACDVAGLYEPSDGWCRAHRAGYRPWRGARRKNNAVEPQ